MRWIALLVASLLLHMMVFNWADGRIGMPSWHEKNPAVITAALLSAPPAEVAVPRPAAPRSAATTSKPKKVRRPAATPAPQPAADAMAAIAPAGIEPVIEATTNEATAADAVAPSESELASSAASASDAQTAPRYKVSPPPSAELTYDVQALRDGQSWYGGGIFRWEAAGSSYSITGEANVTILFKITVLNFKSEGTINDFGIAPVLYSEKPWRKSMTNTHFQHEQQKISFSASTATYPYNGGEQDRASIMWQLAGIGRGDPGQYRPGAEIDVLVAGARDAETWRIQVIGEEEIGTAYGKVAAWHVTRAPRAGSHDQKIDIWLAPQQEWYPVKVRYTYANGDWLDMSLASLAPAAAR